MSNIRHTIVYARSEKCSRMIQWNFSEWEKDINEGKFKTQ